MENKNVVTALNTKLFQADLREKDESQIFIRRSTFNFEQKNGKFPAFGALIALNDETIHGQHKVFRHIEQDTIIVILPLFGAIVYKDSLGNEDIIDTEQLRIFSAKKGMSYELTNPYRGGLINYLQIWLTPKNAEFTAQSQQQSFSVSSKNKLFCLFTNDADANSIPNVPQDCLGYVGIYETGQMAEYTLLQQNSGVFLFVISGTFLVGSQKIQSKDGLSIVGDSKVSFQSLSEDAVLMLMEIPLK